MWERSSAVPATRVAPSACCGPSASMPGRSSSNLLPPQVFFQAHEALVADDDVLDQLDVQDPAGLHKLLCRHDIIIRWGGGAAGVVGAQDEARDVTHAAGAGDRR